MDNADFKSPKTQKSIGDIPRDLIRISVKVIVLILISFFLEKQLRIVRHGCLLCLDAIQYIDKIVSKVLEFYIWKLELKHVLDSI